MNRTHVSAEVKEFPGKMSLPDNHDSLKLKYLIIFRSLAHWLPGCLLFQNPELKVSLPIYYLIIPNLWVSWQLRHLNFPNLKMQLLWSQAHSSIKQTQAIFHSVEVSCKDCSSSLDTEMNCWQKPVLSLLNSQVFTEFKKMWLNIK